MGDQLTEGVRGPRQPTRGHHTVVSYSRPIGQTVSAELRASPVAGDGERSGGDLHAEALSVFDRMAPAHAQPEWVISVNGGSQPLRRVRESLFVVSDGTMGTRGSLEEDGPDTRPGLFVAGVYDHDPDSGQSLVVLPSWATLGVHGSLPPGTRMLDLRSGVLWREVHVGGKTILRTARWSCLDRPGTSVLVAEGDPEVLAQGRAHEVLDVPSALGGGVRGVIDTVRADRDRGHSRAAHVVRTASYASGTHRVPGDDGLAERHRVARAIGPRALLEEQVAAWSARWESADIEVVGDPELTLAARFALFHLAGSVADHGEAAVGARGLSGPAYAGHVFWDSDVFVLPVMAATHPSSARAMLEYRARRLPAAARAAVTLGRRGARFPWESAREGDDVTPRTGVDERGELVPIRTGELEEHITADVAWAAWQAAAWTGRWSALDGRCRGLVVDTARYWASRIRTDAAGRGHIDGVIGPDEYHEDVDDNAFTNVMAAWNLRRGAELVERHVSGSELPEARQWRALADALVDGYDSTTGRHLQFRGFDELESIFVTDVGDVPVGADVVLGHERVARSQVVKQADVLMLHHLLPGSMPAGSLSRDMDYYLPRTAHGSSLSLPIHAALLARLGRLEEALELLDLARRIDLADLTGTTAEGLHLAGLAGFGTPSSSGSPGCASSVPTMPLSSSTPTYLRCGTSSVCACDGTVGSWPSVAARTASTWDARHRSPFGSGTAGCV